MNLLEDTVSLTLFAKVGRMGIYTTDEIPCDPRSGKPNYTIEYPALIYKIHENPNFAGLYVFTDDGLKQMRLVVYSADKLPNTWR